MSPKKGAHDMSKTRFVLTAIVVISLCVPALYAVPVRGAQPREADLDILLNAIRANRKAFVAANIKLTDEEASKFWPLYERYQKEAQAIGDRQAATIPLVDQPSGAPAHGAIEHRPGFPVSGSCAGRLAVMRSDRSSRNHWRRSSWPKPGDGPSRRS